MSLQLPIVNALLRFQIRRRFRKNPDVMEFRAITAGAPPARVPARIALEQTVLGGVPTERLSRSGARDSCAILYIHGGAFVSCSPNTHRPLTWRLADEVGVPVYAIDYRLAPEHPFPAALDDCLAAYRALLGQSIRPEHIAVCGDSAGGNLVLSLALKLKSLNISQPAALVCLSPVTDLYEPALSHTANARTDAMFDPRIFSTVAPRYCPGQDLKNPFISPRRGDPTGLPPTLFQASQAEMLRDDSVLMAEKMRNAGVAVTLQLWPKVGHVWQVAADLLPEGKKAITEISAFLKRQLKV